MIVATGIGVWIVAALTATVVHHRLKVRGISDSDTARRTSEIPLHPKAFDQDQIAHTAIRGCTIITTRTETRFVGGPRDGERWKYRPDQTIDAVNYGHTMAVNLIRADV